MGPGVGVTLFVYFSEMEMEIYDSISDIEFLSYLIDVALPVKYEWDHEKKTSLLIILKKWENNGTEEMS